MKRSPKPERRAYPLRIAPKLYSAMADLAKKEHRTLNAQIVYVLENWLEKQKPQ